MRQPQFAGSRVVVAAVTAVDSLGAARHWLMESTAWPNFDIQSGNVIRKRK